MKGTQALRICGIVSSNTALRGTEPAIRCVKRVRCFIQLRVTGECEAGELLGRHAFSSTRIVRSFVKVKEGPLEQVDDSLLARLRISERERKLRPVAILASTIFRGVQVDLAKLTVQTVARHVPRSVSGEVGHLEVD